MLLPFALALMMLLLLLVAIYAGQADDPFDGNDEERLGVEDRVAALLARLDGRDALAVENQLQGMGPGAIPALLASLRSLDSERSARRPRREGGAHRPLDDDDEAKLRALSIPTQLAVERILADFGLQAVRALRQHLAKVHRGSPQFPALCRVLSVIARRYQAERTHRRNDALNPALQELARDPHPTVALSIALLLRASPELASDELVRSLCAQSAELRLVLLPRLLAEPSLAQELGAALPADDSERLLLEAWRRPDEPTTTPGEHLDPREQERLLAQAEQSSDPGVASRAIASLARWRVAAVAAPLARLVRSGRLPASVLARLREACWHDPELARGVVGSGLRANEAHTVRHAVCLADALPLDELVPLCLRALARHRFGALELLVSAALLRRFDAARPLLRQQLASHERELQLAAVELLFVYGELDDLQAILGLYGQRDYVDLLIGNALELSGAAALPLCRGWLREAQAQREHTERGRHAAELPSAVQTLERRVRLLEALEATRPQS